MAADMFLKIDGIAGESADSKHKAEIDIQSFSFGVSQAGSSSYGGGSGTGKANFQDIHVTKLVDKSSPLLMQKCAGGDHIKNATITMRKAGKDAQEYYIVKLTDLIISSVQNSGSGGESLGEQLSMNYSKIEIQYSPQASDGTLASKAMGGWDLKANKAI